MAKEGKDPKEAYEAAQGKLEAAKTELAAARTALKTFREENGLKRKIDYSEDAKHGKTFKKLVRAETEAQEAVTALESKVKALKPASTRNTKYDYPADVVTAEDKKKYRTKMRNAAKPKKEKPVKEEKAPKAVEEKKKDKKDKKAKKED